MQLDVELKKSFKNFTLDVAFRLSSPRTGIFGPSGSGKSTIMNLLSGLELPDSGYIRLGDAVLFDAKKKINLKPDQRNVGVVFQHAHLFPHMSVKRNIFYGYKRDELILMVFLRCLVLRSFCHEMFLRCQVGSGSALPWRGRFCQILGLSSWMSRFRLWTRGTNSRLFLT